MKPGVFARLCYRCLGFRVPSRCIYIYIYIRICKCKGVCVYIYIYIYIYMYVLPPPPGYPPVGGQAVLDRMVRLTGRCAASSRNSVNESKLISRDTYREQYREQHTL